MNSTKLIPGSVTPLGALYDKEKRVMVLIDKDCIESSNVIEVYPNENTATVWLKTEDLIRIIREHKIAMLLK